MNRVSAVALTLIVVVPIMIGYAMAFEETESTVYETTDQTNITGMILNASTPYYTTSYSPVNNSQLIVKATYIGSGVTETTVRSPAYQSITSTYTSLPVYEQQTGTIEVSAMQQTTSAGHSNGASATVVSYGNEIPAGMGYYYISTDELAQYEFSNQWYLGYDAGPILASNGNEWTWHTSIRDYIMGTDFAVVSDRSPTYTITYRAFSDLEIDTNYSLDLGTSATVVKITHLDDTVEYYRHITSGACTIVKSGSVAIIDTTTYNNVKMVSIASANNATNLTYTYTAPSGTYGNPSYGWQLPTISGAAITPYWINGQINQYVRMMVHLENGESTSFYERYNNNYSSYLTVSRSTGSVSVSSTDFSQNLGDFEYLCVEFTSTGATVSGLSAWPTMGADPIKINSVDVPFAIPLQQFTQIQINSASNGVEYRVDAAEILAGTYPSTYNYTLNMASYWPDSNYSIAMSTIAVYGDTITFGGETFAVNNGSINGIRLLKAVFSTTYDAGTAEWINTINGVEISRTASAATITFGGEWSIIASAYKVVESTSTELTWTPGKFAWNGVDQSFALMGLITCAAVFVGLGMYGARSGAKVGKLMIICGCAAFVFLALM